MLADAFNVLHEMRRGVCIPRQIRMTSARAALIKKDGAMAIRIENAPVHVLCAAARTTMQEQRGKALRIADLFNEKPMALAHRQHARVVRPEAFRQRLIER